jgi:hypothetical protein
MAAPLDFTRGFQAGAPVPLFSVLTASIGNSGRQYAVSRDGQRFLINAIQTENAATTLTVALNWRPGEQR